MPPFDWQGLFSKTVANEEERQEGWVRVVDLKEERRYLPEIARLYPGVSALGNEKDIFANLYRQFSVYSLREGECSRLAYFRRKTDTPFDHARDYEESLEPQIFRCRLTRKEGVRVYSFTERILNGLYEWYASAKSFFVWIFSPLYE